MKKRIRLIGIILLAETLTVVPLCFWFLYRATQTEELRMTDQYVVPFAEKLISGVVFVLLSPSIFLTVLISSLLPSNVFFNMFLMVAINIVITGLLLFVLFAIFSKIMPKRK